MNLKTVEWTPHPGPLPIGSADSADAEREKRPQRLGKIVRRMVHGSNARMVRGILLPPARSHGFRSGSNHLRLGLRALSACPLLPRTSGPLWRSATVSKTSRSSVASQKNGRTDPAHRMMNVAAAGFQHSRGPALRSTRRRPKILCPAQSSNGRHPLAERDCVEDQSQQRGQPDDLSSGSSPVNGESSCVWLSAQPRPGVRFNRSQFRR